MAAALLFLCVEGEAQTTGAVDPSRPAPVASSTRGTTTVGEGSDAAGLRALAEQARLAQDGSNAATALLEDLLQQGLNALSRARAVEEELARLDADSAQAPTRIETLKAAITGNFDISALELRARAVNDLAGASRELRGAESALSAAERQVVALSERLARLRTAPERAQAALETARVALTDVQAALDAPPPAEEAPPITALREAAQRARQRMLNADVALWDQQILKQDLLLSLVGAELEAAQHAVAAAELEAGVWRKAAEALRARDASARAKEARQTADALAAMPDNVRRVAEIASAGANDLRALTVREADISKRLIVTQARLREVDENLASVKQRIAIAGLNETIALVLRRQRQNLPTLSSYQQLAAELREETAWATNLQLDAERARARLVNVEAVAEQLLRNAQPPLPPVALAFLQPRIVDLLRQTKATADSVFDASSRYIKQLGRLDNAERQLVSRSETFDRLISEHLLWVRSTSTLSAAQFTDAARAVELWLQPANWIQVLRSLRQEAVEALYLWFAAAALLILLFLLRPLLIRYVNDQSAATLKVRTDAFGRTTGSVLATATVALIAPAALFALGVALTSTPAGTAEQFRAAVGEGARAAAYQLFGFGLAFELLRNGGIGDTQFRWPQAVRRALRRQLRWFAPLALVLTFVVAALQSLDDTAFHVSLGRILFVCAMFAVGAFLGLILRPSGPLMSSTETVPSGGFVYRLRYLWFGTAMAVPSALAVLSVAGYHYSATQLEHRLQTSLWLALALVVIAEIMLRWLFIARRRLAFQQAAEARLAERRARVAAAERQEPGAPEWKEARTETTELDTEDSDEPEVTVEDLEAQASQVVHTVVGILAIVGLWWIWADVLPALNVLKEVVLWHTAENVDGVETLVPVTLVHAGFAVMVAALTYVAARNLPAALELLVLNQLPLDQGAKYAFSTLSRYLIAGIGVTAVFGLLGMEWSRLQWLVAALSVGLGFGLQEIVANFVSGLILLFERPIRVGDVVTVNGSHGTVSKIQIRATTLIDFDQKELIMPNKVFITGEVLNWTLSNHTTRLMVHVGVAYGTDTRKAMALLVEAAREHPEVLDEPEPLATFEGFGDSALALTLRCYKASLDGRLEVVSDLHAAIDKKLGDAGISIPFPQRDVRLDTGGAPLDVRVRRDETGGGASA
ncbi:MAG: mechanosensitive ion channel domain-containing protein [Pseudomonadota bacterium]